MAIYANNPVIFSISLFFIIQPSRQFDAMADNKPARAFQSALCTVQTAFPRSPGEDFTMSSISSTSASGLSQLFQNLAASATSASNGSTGTTSNASSGTAATGHHHHGGGGFSKLADAIESALQSASNASSGSTSTDANQTITQALEKIFENGGLGGTGTSDDDASSSTPVSNNTSTGASSTTSTDNGLPADFVQTLKNFGVTPQQFQTDLTAALKSAQENGSVDVSSVLKNFPIGSVVDSVG
jgi:hypothetical protein